MKNFINWILLTVLVVACKASPTSQTDQPVIIPSATALTPIRLPMGYIPNVQYAPFYVAAEKGYFAEAGLELTFDYSYETDGVNLVGVNELQFSLVSGDQVLLARAQGLPVVYVLAWWQQYPVAIAALSEQNLTHPSELRGKQIGLPGPFGASYIGLQALLKAGGLKESDVTLDSIGFNQVEALVTGKDQAVVVYDNNESVQLRKRGYEINVLRVADYVNLASNGLLTNEITINENPELVRAMVQAILRGVEDVLDDPNEAFEICKNYVEGLEQADSQIQREILQASIEYWKAETLGLSQAAAWTNMQQTLLDMGSLTEPIELEKAYTNQFVLETP